MKSCSRELKLIIDDALVFCVNAVLNSAEAAADGILFVDKARRHDPQRPLSNARACSSGSAGWRGH